MRIDASSEGHTGLAWAAWADFWRRLNARRARWPVVTIGPVGLDRAQFARARRALAGLSEQLCLCLELSRTDAQVLLATQPFVRQSSASELEWLAQGRPVLAMPVEAPGASAAGQADATARLRQALLGQLLALPIVRRQSPQWSASGWPPEWLQATRVATADGAADAAASGIGVLEDADPWHVEPLQGPVRWFVDAFRHGLRERPTETIEASFGEGATLRVDFAQQWVRIDAPALKALRVERRLPRLAPGWMPSADAYRRDLEDIAWDVGLACGRAGWFDAPPDPWHAPLVGVAASQIARYSRHPTHHAVARVLQAGPVSPAALQQQAGLDVPAVRRLVQACLLLGLARWAS